MMNLGHESETVEFKQTTGLIKEGVKSIVAMLNKNKTATLYFGVADNGDVAGQCVSDETLRDIVKHIKDSVRPKISPIISREPIENNAREYIRVYCEGARRPYTYKNEHYLRSATCDNKIATEAEIRFLIKPLEKDSFDYPDSGEFFIDGCDVDKILPKTKIEKLLRNLWEETFETPLLIFDRCVIIGGEVSLNIEHLDKIKSNLSSSEKYFLSLFLNNYSTTIVADWFKELPMLVSISNKKGIQKIQHLFHIYPYLLNGMKVNQDE